MFSHLRQFYVLLYCGQWLALRDEHLRQIYVRHSLRPQQFHVLFCCGQWLALRDEHLQQFYVWHLSHREHSAHAELHAALVAGDEQQAVLQQERVVALVAGDEQQTVLQQERVGALVAGDEQQERVVALVAGDEQQTVLQQEHAVVPVMHGEQQAVLQQERVVALVMHDGRQLLAVFAQKHAAMARVEHQPQVFQWSLAAHASGFDAASSLEK